MKFFSLTPSEIILMLENSCTCRIKSLNKIFLKYEYPVYDLYIPFQEEISNNFSNQFNYILSGFKKIEIDNEEIKNSEYKEILIRFKDELDYENGNQNTKHLKKIYCYEDGNEKELFLLETILNSFETFINNHLFNSIYELYVKYNIEPTIIESSSIIFVGPNKISNFSIPGAVITWTPRNKNFIDNLFEILNDVKNSKSEEVKNYLVKDIIEKNSEIIKDINYIQLLFNDIVKKSEFIYNFKPIEFVDNYRTIY